MLHPKESGKRLARPPLFSARPTNVDGVALEDGATSVVDGSAAAVEGEEVEVAEDNLEAAVLPEEVLVDEDLQVVDSVVVTEGRRLRDLTVLLASTAPDDVREYRCPR